MKLVISCTVTRTASVGLLKAITLAQIVQVGGAIGPSFSQRMPGRGLSATSLLTTEELGQKAIRPEWPNLTGAQGVICASDPGAGSLCFKGGATTGPTYGIMGHVSSILFRRGTADAPQPTDQATNIESCSLLVLNFDLDTKLYEKGDSGAAILCPVPDQDGWNLVGMLVSRGTAQDSGQNMPGYVIPQSELFRSLNEVTGRTGRVAQKM